MICGGRLLLLPKASMFPDSVLKALVNHSTIGGDVTGGYVIMTVERLREPVQRIADRIKTLCGLSAVAGGKVSKLRQRL